MNDGDFQIFLKQKKQQIDELMVEQIKGLNSPDVLKEAMLYSVQAGGKRIRPILLLATMEAFQLDSKLGLPISCAIEMIHTYSLIHDDLPAMDDDDLRRGQLTNHKVFGEAIAILAGDGLLTYSFEIVAGIQHPQVTEQTKATLVIELARAAGAEGMVRGQTADLQAEGRALTVNQLEDVHLHKTGKLLTYSVEAGALLAHASYEQICSLRNFSRHLGLAFQIRDDILDVEGDPNHMGKTPGGDAVHEKSTYPQVLTLEGAKEKLESHLKEAKQCLHEANIDHECLEQITDYIVRRNH